MTVLMFESQLMEMPGPRDIVIDRPNPRAFSVVLGTHFGAKAPGCPGEGGMVSGQIDTCINNVCIVHSLSSGKVAATPS